MATVPLRQRVKCLPDLGWGAVLGLSLGMIARTVTAAHFAELTVLAFLPFLLAVLTGVAKSTTA